MKRMIVTVLLILSLAIPAFGQSVDQLRRNLWRAHLSVAEAYVQVYLTCPECAATPAERQKYLDSLREIQYYKKLLLEN